MSIKNRVQKLEAKKNPELLNVVIHKPFSDRPLPEPYVSGGVRVCFQYDDAPKGKPM
jgi:hypothetical protein